tara:strand:- start:161 stop:1171 length:1011 start_codon:yes stop_codon:yes gene_type:complete
MKKNKVLIIAEAGVNHNGKLLLAKKLVDVAVRAKADIIKFQTFKAENIVTQNLERAAYQKKYNKIKQTQYEMLRKLQLSEEDQIKLFKYCNLKKIRFLSTPFDIESFLFLKKLNLNLYKIPSGEITNIPLLKKIGAENKKIILSTGMSTLKEIEIALKILNNSGTKKNKITVLHCTTEYPAPFQDLNLNAIQTLKNKLKVDVGYSDHSSGIEVAIAAVALGATIIEKHFTLNKKFEGPDHSASLCPDELIQMTASIRNIEKALGSSKKLVTKSERKNLKMVRKYIVASKIIKKGDKFSQTNLTTKRSGRGISAIEWFNLLGKISKKNYSVDSIITD